jgi:hypothetical protein
MLWLLLLTIDSARSETFTGNHTAFDGHRQRIGGSEISFSGSYRLRSEIQDEFDIQTFGTGKTEVFLLARLRLETGIQFNQKLRIHLQLQDARVLGSSFPDFSTGNHPFRDPLDVNEAYIEGRPIKPISIKIGRQTISFRDRRIFGPGDWGNTGRYAWDAARLTLTTQYLESNGIVGRFILHQPNQWPNQPAEGPTAYACYNSLKALPFQCDLFYVYKDDQRGITRGEKSTGNLAAHSAGVWLKHELGSWDYAATFAGQIGRHGSDKIRALGVMFSAGRKFNGPGLPYIQLQYIRGSGDKNPADGVNHTFDGIFGGADTDLYGWMNLFFWKNINEYRINWTFNPGKILSVRGEYHYFRLDQASDAWYFPGKVQRRDKTGVSGRELGHEFDLSARMQVTRFLELLAGSCLFFPGDFIQNTGESPRASWHFLQTTFCF